MLNDKLPEKLISVLGTAALSAVFALWCAVSRYSAAGYAAAGLSTALMLALCLLLVPRWCAFWRKNEPERLGETDGGECARIFALIVIWDVLMLVLGFVLRKVLGYDESAGGYIRFWLCTDSRHYMDIARDWYLSDGEWDRLVQLVFLPGYPVIVRLFAYITGNELAAGLFVSALCFAGSGVMLYKLVSLDEDSAAAKRAVKLFALSPAAFFFAAPMSESLFVLCTVSCLYLLRRGKLITGSLIGAYAAFTRSPGLILIVPILLELVHKRAKPREYLSLVIVPLGFAAYCLVNYTVSGDAPRRAKNTRIIYGVFHRLLYRYHGSYLASERTALSCGNDIAADSSCGFEPEKAHGADTHCTQRTILYRVFYRIPSQVAGLVKK